MPDTICHYLFGLDATKQISDSPLYKIIKNNRNLFFIGCQGPDPMYYHKPYKAQNFSGVASKMHHEKTGYFLSSALCYIKKFKEQPELFEPGLAFVCGLLCHYALDTTAHPYIFYLGGRYNPQDPATAKYKGRHKEIELALDALLLQETFGLKANRFKVHKHILKDIEIPEILTGLFDELLFSIYAIPKGGTIYSASYQDFRNYFKLTYDHLGVKKNLFHMISPVLPHHLGDYSNAFSYYHCIDDLEDYMNADKHVWLHPVTGNVYTYSFKDLLRNAHKTAHILLNTSWDFMQSEVSLETLESLLPNISYLTGLSLSDQRPMQYFKY